MKISLFTKSYIIKACSFFVLISIIAGIPSQANAGFFNNLMASVMGVSAQAEDSQQNTDNSTDFGTDNFSNSQTMPVLETSSVDPDTKSISSSAGVNIVDGGMISPDLAGSMGVGLESVSNGEMTTYIVQEGDTLSEIAMQYDISTNTIRWENNISGNSIKAGQKLNILPVTGVKHIIKKGDTLEKIAAKYDADVEDIMVFNGVDKNDQLKAGDVLYIPNGIIKPVVVIQKPTSIKKTTSSSDSNVSVGSGYYIRPALGPTTSPYGPRRRGFHYGIDIGASRGTRVVAAAAGTIVETVSYCIEGRSSCGGRYGNYIVIEHSNGTFTRYAHLSKVGVSVGESVSQGESIGATGNTGHSTGPHLHFQIEKSNGATIRPKF